eukprot:scaffold20228_cov117-Isochrysis_galbana.AAC.2
MESPPRRMESRSAPAERQEMGHPALALHACDAARGAARETGPVAQRGPARGRKVGPDEQHCGAPGRGRRNHQPGPRRAVKKGLRHQCSRRTRHIEIG